MNCEEIEKLYKLKDIAESELNLIKAKMPLLEPLGISTPPPISKEYVAKWREVEKIKNTLMDHKESCSICKHDA